MKKRFFLILLSFFLISIVIGCDTGTGVSYLPPPTITEAQSVTIDGETLPKISWETVDGSKSYRLYRNGESIAEIPQPIETAKRLITIIDKVGTPKGQLIYRVSSLSLNGQEGPQSQGIIIMLE